MNNEKVLPNRCHEPFLSQKNRLTMRFFQGLKSFEFNRCRRLGGVVEEDAVDVGDFVDYTVRS